MYSQLKFDFEEDDTLVKTAMWNKEVDLLHQASEDKVTYKIDAEEF